MKVETVVSIWAAAVREVAVGIRVAAGCSGEGAEPPPGGAANPIPGGPRGAALRPSGMSAGAFPGFVGGRPSVRDLGGRGVPEAWASRGDGGLVPVAHGAGEVVGPLPSGGGVADGGQGVGEQVGRRTHSDVRWRDHGCLVRGGLVPGSEAPAKTRHRAGGQCLRHRREPRGTDRIARPDGSTNRVPTGHVRPDPACSLLFVVLALVLLSDGPSLVVVLVPWKASSMPPGRSQE